MCYSVPLEKHLIKNSDMILHQQWKKGYTWSQTTTAVFSCALLNEHLRAEKISKNFISTSTSNTTNSFPQAPQGCSEKISGKHKSHLET